MNDGSSAAHERLHTIADLLGISAARFYESASPPSPEDTIELNYLWHRLKTPAGRAAALDALNKILDEEDA